MKKVLLIAISALLFSNCNSGIVNESDVRITKETTNDTEKNIITSNDSHLDQQKNYRTYQSYLYDAYSPSSAAQPKAVDYDGDGKADLSVKTNNGVWLIDYAFNGFKGWDLRLTGYGDLNFPPCPADYDGDKKADISVKGIDGRWIIDYASNGFGSWDITYYSYGNLDYVPLPADYDGDRKSDLSVKGIDGRWLIDYARNGFGSWDLQLNGYGNFDYTPCPADYDGDGKSDLSLKGIDGRWLIDYARNGFGGWDLILYNYGNFDYTPCPADYDGDKQADITVFCYDGRWLVDFACNGFGSWDITTNTLFGQLKSKNGTFLTAPVRAPFIEEVKNHKYVPIPADFDGDGKSNMSAKNMKQNYVLAGLFDYFYSDTLWIVDIPSHYYQFPLELDPNYRFFPTSGAIYGYCYRISDNI